LREDLVVDVHCFNGYAVDVHAAHAIDLEVTFHFAFDSFWVELRNEWRETFGSHVWRDWRDRFALQHVQDRERRPIRSSDGDGSVEGMARTVGEVDAAQDSLHRQHAA
jgi:hypothetical protein